MGMLHATCVRFLDAGILLRGPSGCGKSDAALRLIDAGGILVGDDRVDARDADGRILARAPAALAGLVEARGLGVLPIDHLTESSVDLVVDLVPSDAVERMPQPERARIDGVELPRIALSPFEASFVVKIKLAIAALRGGRLGVPTEAA